MTLSYTSYYGTKGELLKAYNLVEPFTVNDLYTTDDNAAGISTVETWLGASMMEIYDELLAIPNTLSYMMASTLNSTVTIESGEEQLKLELSEMSWEGAALVGGVEPLDSIGDYFTAIYAYSSLEYGQTMSGTLRVIYDNDTHVVDNQVSPGYGDIGGSGFEQGIAHGTAVLVRDYTGTVFIMNILPTGQGRTHSRFKGISLRAINRFPEFMDAEFWSGINDEEPDKEEGVGIVDINNRFAPRTSMNGLGVYPITRGDLQGFVKDLWTESFSEKILKFVNGDVMNNIVSVRWFYGIGGSIPRTEAGAYIRLGNQSMRGDLGTRTVIARPAVSELMTYTMGSLLVPRKYNNFLDLSPFTRLQVFVPYVGFVNLDMTEFAGRRLRLDYNINIVSGAAVAYIYVQNSDGSWRIAHEQATTLGVEIPLSINSRESMSNRITTAIAGTAVTAGGAAVGSLLGPVGAIGGAMAGAGVSQSVLSGGAQIASNGISGLSSTLSSAASSRNGGGIDNETGSLGDFQPSILITRPKAIPPSDYNMQVGLPDNNSGTVGSFNGYIKAGAIKQSAVSGLPRQAMDEITQMLRAGVYTQ